MAKRSTSSNEVLLGMLAIEAMSGYDLGVTIRSSVGHIWNESYGQIYPNLKKLEAEGFVTAKTERQKGKPDKRIYSLTKKGRERLTRWLAVDPQPEIARNELLLKLFFGDQTSVDVLIGHMRGMIEREEAVFNELTRLEREDIAQSQQYPGAPYWKMAARFGQMELEAHLRWARETMRALEDLRKKHPSDRVGPKEKKHAGK